MARFYFDIDDNGDVDIDEVGSDCETLAVAKREAIGALAEIAKVVVGADGHHVIRINVRTEDGSPVLRVSMHFDVEEVEGQMSA